MVPGAYPFHGLGGGLQAADDALEREGTVLFSLTKERGIEGIVAKRKDSIYRPGKRTSDGIKIKSRPEQEFVVGGFTEGKGSRKVESGCARCCWARIATGNFTINTGFARTCL